MVHAVVVMVVRNTKVVREVAEVVTREVSREVLREVAHSTSSTYEAVRAEQHW